MDVFKLNAQFTSGHQEAEQLRGDIELLPDDEQPDIHELSGSFSDVRRGVWTRLDGSKVDVAVKKLRTSRITSSVDAGTVADRMLLVRHNRLPKNDTSERSLPQRVKRESVIWNGLTHPNVLRLYGYRIEDYVANLIAPWCPRKNLRAYLTTHSDLSFLERFHLVSFNPLDLNDDVQ